MNGKSISAVVDRIEGGVIVLVTGGGLELKLPLAALPEAGEGDVVRCRFDLDKAAGQRRKNRVQELLKELGASDEN
ncbi:MAG: DUF3006 domain-containing protein [bacterium]|nr:DUF3006 domain-containing protein [bacterium]